MIIGYDKRVSCSSIYISDILVYSGISFKIVNTTNLLQTKIERHSENVDSIGVKQCNGQSFYYKISQYSGCT